MNTSDIETALEESEFFRKLKKEDIRKIAPLCKITVYDAGEFVFQQGDNGEHLYIIAEGQIFLERSLDMGNRKANVVIETLGKGRVVGCWATLLDDPHILMTTATCQKPTQVVSLKGRELRKLMREDGEIGFLVLERLCFLLKDRVQAAYGALEKI